MCSYLNYTSGITVGEGEKIEIDEIKLTP